MIKLILTVLLVVIAIKCKNSPTPATQEEIDKYMDSIYESNENYAVIDFPSEDEFFELLGFKPLVDYELESIDDRVYRMEYYVALGQQITVTEVSNIDGQVIISFVAGNVDNECNPINGSKKLSPECLLNKIKYEKIVPRLVLDSLDELLDQHEFWELAETSDKFKNDVIMDGTDRTLHVWYVELEDQDSIETKRRKIRRFLPEFYPSITAIGKYIEEVAEN